LLPSGNCCNQAWLLENFFQGIPTSKFVRKLLNVRSPWTLKFVEITASVPFSTATLDCVNYPANRQFIG
jgi:hypothetical protein